MTSFGLWRQSRDSTITQSAGILLCSMISVFIACEASAGDPWDRFLANPEQESVKELAKAIDPSRCGWGKPENEEVIPARVRPPLFELISSGNESAFLAGVLVVRCFDGAHLEEFYQSAGWFLEKHPQRFLTLVTEQSVSVRDIASMASSVVVVDDLDAELRKVTERIELLRDLKDQEFARAHAESMRALQEREADLNRMKASLE